MTRNSTGQVSRDMAAPAPDSDIAPPKFWWLKAIIYGISLTLLGTIISIKNGLLQLFKTKKSIKGQVVVISGSGRGLGRHLALKLSRLGAHIACVDINTKNNEETVQLIKQEGGKAEAFTVNVAKSGQVDEFSKEVVKKLGPVEILVNNAALVMAVPLDEMSYEDIRAFYEVNVMSSVFMCKAFLEDMRKRNSGHIVAISSIASFNSLPWLSLYCSTKAALSKFMDTLNVELNITSGNKVKTTTISPFFINTSADYFKWVKSSVPILKEEMVVDEIVSGILYEKTSVFIPPIFSLLYLLNGFIDLHTYNLTFKFFKGDSRVPSKKEREELPYGQIVKQTTFDQS